MHPHIEQAIERATANIAFANERFGKLTKEQLGWKPGPDLWGVGECLDHLITTQKQYESGIDRAISGVTERVKDYSETFRPDWIGRLFIRAVRPESTRRVKTFPVFSPAADFGTRNIVSDFVTLQNRFVEQMKRSDGLDINRIRVKSPASRFIRLSLGVIFDGLTLHQQRHFQQAERVINLAEFPGS